MLIQTSRRCLGLGLGMTLLWMLTGKVLRAQEMPETRLPVSISVYDDARVGADVVLRAEQEAAEIFAQAGIDTSWFRCGEGATLTHVSTQCGKAVAPTNLVLRIVNRPRGLKPGIFGISYLSAEGLGCYSYVFLEPIEELQREFPGSLATLLGHVAAHEVAHLLLGVNSHSPAGLMRANWQREELQNLVRRRLLFNKSEAMLMSARLAPATQAVVRGAAETPLVVAAAPTARASLSLPPKNPSPR